MENLSKKNRIVNRVISMIIGILIGVVLVVLGAVVKAEKIVELALIVWGVIIIVSNVPGLIYSIANIKNKAAIFDLIMSIVGILLGVGLIISQSKVITIILAAYMIIFPVIRIALAKSGWAEQLKREALRLILGVVLLVFGGTIVGGALTILNMLLSIIGWVVIALTAIFGIIEILVIVTKKEA